MSMMICPMQEICRHYSSGTRRPSNHDVRSHYPCHGWVSVKCPVLLDINMVMEYATGEKAACDINKGGKK